MRQPESAGHLTFTRHWYFASCLLTRLPSKLSCLVVRQAELQVRLAGFGPSFATELGTLDQEKDLGSKQLKFSQRGVINPSQKCEGALLGWGCPWDSFSPQEGVVESIQEAGTGRTQPGGMRGRDCILAPERKGAGLILVLIHLPLAMPGTLSAEGIRSSDFTDRGGIWHKSELGNHWICWVRIGPIETQCPPPGERSSLRPLSHQHEWTAAPVPKRQPWRSPGPEPLETQAGASQLQVESSGPGVFQGKPGRGL